MKASNMDYRSCISGQIGLFREMVGRTPQEAALKVRES